MKLRTLMLGGALALAAVSGLADDIHYNQISLRAEASQEVPRDLMIVTLPFCWRCFLALCH